jgi:hypothetical protein
MTVQQPNSFRTGPDERGHFGLYGGRFVAETLMPLILELEQAYAEAKNDPRFCKQMDGYLKDYVGRPSPLYFAERLSGHLRGAKVYFKREDLNHTGAAQSEQRAGADIARPPHGQAARDCRNRRRHARGCDRDDVRQIRPRVHRLYGCGRRRAAEAQRAAHARLGSRGAPGRVGIEDAQGRDERGAARLGHECFEYLLLHRHGGRAASPIR